jgi:hypothetical protein
MEYRIPAAMKQLSIGREEAVAYIDKVDRKREKWTQFLYGVQWKDPSQYDIVLNLDRFGIESACMTVSRMVELDDFKVTPESLQAQADLLLSSKVWITLAKDASTQGAFVKVSADHGKVSIYGNAGSGKVVDAVTTVAGNVPGVREVVSEVGMGSDWYW